MLLPGQRDGGRSDAAAAMRRPHYPLRNKGVFNFFCTHFMGGGGASLLWMCGPCGKPGKGFVNVLIVL